MYSTIIFTYIYSVTTPENKLNVEKRKEILIMKFKSVFHIH